MFTKANQWDPLAMLRKKGKERESIVIKSTVASTSKKREKGGFIQHPGTQPEAACELVRTARRGWYVTTLKRRPLQWGPRGRTLRLAMGWGPGEQEAPSDDQRRNQQVNLKSGTLLNLDVLFHKMRSVNWKAWASL